MTDQSAEARRSKWLHQPRAWVVVLLVLLLLLIVFVVGLYIVGHLHETKMDRQREAIESFVVPAGWEDLPHFDGNIGPFTGSLCLAPALFCDWSHSRRWNTAGLQSATALKAAAEASGWQEIEFSGEPPTLRYSDACQQEGEGDYWCSLRAVSGGVSLELTVGGEFWGARVDGVRVDGSGGERWWARLEAR